MADPVIARCRKMVAPLHRRFFLWFGVAMVVSSCVGVAVSIALGGANAHSSWKSYEGAKRVMANRFAESWDEPLRRDQLAEEIARELNVDVTVRDASGEALASYGEEECSRKRTALYPTRDGRQLGRVDICPTGAPRPLPMLLGIIASVGVLWLFAHKVARHLGRPILDLVRVTDAIGRGDYDVRANLRRHPPREILHLSRAIEDMAGKIKQQLADQRELLASVSHELRSPLARIRLVLELVRDETLPKAHREKMYAELEHEVLEIDDLVGGLLAQSRLEFSALTVRPNDLVALAQKSAERAGLALTPRVEGEPRPVSSDATLIARALTNLLDNAKRHGAGATDVVLRFEREQVVVEVRDRGAGLEGLDLDRIFDPFFGRPKGSSDSLGLGLSLVRRIAEAHGGTAFAKPREGGGAVVGLTLATGVRD